MSPAQRHAGHDHHILGAVMRCTCKRVNATHDVPTTLDPLGSDWTPIAAVTLNPERDAVVSAATGIANTERKVA